MPELFSFEVYYGTLFGLPCDSQCDASRILFHDKKNSIVISFLLPSFRALHSIFLLYYYNLPFHYAKVELGEVHSTEFMRITVSTVCILELIKF